MIDPGLAGSGGWKPKKKSTKSWWGALVFLIVLASVIAGFHFGGKELLRVQADQRAVERVELPVPTEDRPQVTEWRVDGRGQSITYRFAIFPNGLECLVSSRHMTCNWDHFNANRAVEETDS